MKNMFDKIKRIEQKKCPNCGNDKTQIYEFNLINNIVIYLCHTCNHVWAGGKIFFNIRNDNINYKKKYYKLKKELNKYKKLSLIDSLTGLYNRRKLEQDLERQLELQQRYGVKMAVMMIDINKFKNINDTYGHIQGDKTLNYVATVLKQTVRATERVYRLSGDEFIIIFFISKKQYLLEKRIRETLKKINIEVSIGVEKLQNNILEIIDSKMYKDKKYRK